MLFCFRSLAMLLALTALVAGDEPPRTDRDTHTGTIVAIDVTTGTLELKLTGDVRRNEKFNLQRDTKVLLDGKDAKLADLKVGMPILAHCKKDTLDVFAVNVEGRTARALLQAVDAAANTISLTTEGAPRIVPLAKEVVVLIGGKEGKLTDLRPGAVVLKYDLAGERVIQVRSGDGRDGERPRAPSVRGFFKSFDATTREIVVTVRGEGRESVFSATLDREAAVVKGRVAMKFEELKDGTEIALILSPDRKIARLIQVVIRDGEREK